MKMVPAERIHEELDAIERLCGHDYGCVLNGEYFAWQPSKEPAFYEGMSHVLRWMRHFVRALEG